jgi:transcriptional regulator with XRE-family HTH domain
MRRAAAHPGLPFWAEMAFGERLSALRKERGLTQQALAERVDLHVTLIRRYEAGKTQPGFDALRKIAVALSVSADELLFDPEERGPSDELRLQFEAASRLSDEEMAMVKNVLEGILLRHEARRLAV